MEAPAKAKGQTATRRLAACGASAGAPPAGRLACADGVFCCHARQDKALQVKESPQPRVGHHLVHHGCARQSRGAALCLEALSDGTCDAGPGQSQGDARAACAGVDGTCEMRSVLTNCR